MMDTVGENVKKSFQSQEHIRQNKTKQDKTTNKLTNEAEHLYFRKHHKQETRV